MSTKTVMQQYVEDSGRTDAPCGPDNIHLHLHDGSTKNFLNDLLYVAITGHVADIAKRAIFYGTSKEKLDQRQADQGVKFSAFNAYLTDENTPNPEIDELQWGLIHAVLGVVSEAGEIIEAILNSIQNGTEIDRVNLNEELGDILWYAAKAARHLDTDFEKAGTVNLEKLKVRFPEKFSQEKAENRDLDAELEVLQQGTDA